MISTASFVLVLCFSLPSGTTEYLLRGEADTAQPPVDSLLVWFSWTSSRCFCSGKLSCCAPDWEERRVAGHHQQFVGLIDVEPEGDGDTNDEVTAGLLCRLAF